MYKLYVRDQYLNRVAEIDDYQGLEMIPRFNGVGTWLLDLPTDCEAAKEIIKPKSGIQVVRDGQTLFSGIVSSRNRKWDITGDRTTVSGYDDNIHLLYRLGYPVPSGDFSLQDYDIRTGPAETVLKQYVEANLGSLALPERRLHNIFLEPDKGLGKSVTGRARFHTLLELFTSLALAGGDLGFRIVQVGNTLQFQVYEPTDKTREVFFSPLMSNLRSFEYSTDNPESNYSIVGGGGEGKNRILLERGDSASITEFWRIETFIDRRDTTETEELYQALDEELAEKAQKASLSISPIDTESQAFGREYQLGDKVSVVLTRANEIMDIDTLYYFISSYQTVPVDVKRYTKIQEKLEVIQDVIREVKISITPNGETIAPVIGTPESTSNPIRKIFNKLRKIDTRTSNLERR